MLSVAELRALADRFDADGGVMDVSIDADEIAAIHVALLLYAAVRTPPRVTTSTANAQPHGRVLGDPDRCPCCGNHPDDCPMGGAT